MSVFQVEVPSALGVRPFKEKIFNVRSFSYGRLVERECGIVSLAMDN